VKRQRFEEGGGIGRESTPVAGCPRGKALAFWSAAVLCRFSNLLGASTNQSARGLAQSKTCGASSFNIGILAILFFAAAAGLCAQQAAPEEGRTRFCAVDIFIDSKATPLAAYQLQFEVTNHVAKIVGIEGGEHPAFAKPPFYDPKAMQQERVILAAFSTERNLPTGRTRVATIHLQVQGTEKPQYELRLQVAADENGKHIFAQIEQTERKQ
jgi:hypothetical protein